jgi:hypothetical protein
MVKNNQYRKNITQNTPVEVQPWNVAGVNAAIMPAIADIVTVTTTIGKNVPINMFVIFCFMIFN